MPIDSTKGIKMLYVFVDIKLDATHFVDTVRHNFEVGSSLALVSTIQFVATLQVCKCFTVLNIYNVNFFLIDCCYQSSIARFSPGIYCKQERLTQALGNGILPAARPRFSWLAASSFATRVLRELLPAVNCEEKKLRYTCRSVSSVRSCADYFIYLFFILSYSFSLTYL